MQAMMGAFVISLTGVLCGVAPAVTLQYNVQQLGQDLFRIEYTLSAADFLANQELDIRFDAMSYRALSNGVAPAQFDLLLLQPNNPPGAEGVYSALALVDHPDTAGRFSVDALMFNSLQPGPQLFAVNQLDQNGNIVSLIDEGTTVASVPEPATLAVTGTALLLISCVLPACRRRLKKTV